MQKMIFLMILGFIISVSILTDHVFAQESLIPQWIKDTASWWAFDKIDDSDFIQSMEFLVNQKIINISSTILAEEKSDSVPYWIKNNAGWWSDGMISDTDFVGGIEFMINNRVITIGDSASIMKMNSTNVAKKISNDTQDMIMQNAAQNYTMPENMLIQNDANHTMMNTDPIVTHMGTFSGLRHHHGEGIAKIIAIHDERYLRFEDFKVTNGPDLYVYLAPSGNVQEGQILQQLKGNTGNQNYLLSVDIDLIEYDTVVVYCKLFGVYFAEAQIEMTKITHGN